MALATHALITGDGVACARAVREALAVAPGSADVHDMRGRLLSEVGRPEDALACLRMAVQLEPSNSRARGDMVRMHAFLGNWRPAEDLVDHAEETGEGVAFVLCARLAMWKGDLDLVRRLRARVQGIDFAFKKAVTELTDLTLTGNVSVVLRELATVWGKISGRATRRPIFFRQLAAEVAAFARLDDEALQSIESADHLGLIDRVWIDGCPLLARLHESPRFQTARGRVDARASAVLAALEGGS
jgi:serine/threonine-protein kinase